MIINSAAKPRLVDEYDIVFTNGMLLPVTVDKDLGDTIEFDELSVTITRAARPSQFDPDQIVPSEDVTIFQQHILTITHRQRTIMPVLPEQQEQLRKTFVKGSN